MKSIAHKKHVMHVGPNMTPMVDIVMCILIFFMLGSSLAVPELYLTSVPAINNKGLGTMNTDAKLPAVSKWIKMVRIGSETKVEAFDHVFEGIGELSPTAGSPSRAEVIGAQLASIHDQLSKDVQIIIAPEATVPYQDVVTMYDLCIKARFENVAFASPK